MTMKKINLKNSFQKFDDRWSPKLLEKVNDFHIKVYKGEGEGSWHQHENDDQLFLVIKGTLTVRHKKGEVMLNEGELVVVPRGVEHQPYAEEECHVLLFEPKGAANEEDREGEETIRES